jgi:hypothetical protein
VPFIFSQAPERQEQPDPGQDVKSILLLHAICEINGLQTWHGLAGFSVAPNTQAPLMTQCVPKMAVAQEPSNAHSCEVQARPSLVGHADPTVNAV